MDPPLGAIVTIPQGRGVVRFKGPTSFMTAGKWVGIELYEKNGKNDGSVDGIPYFNCEMGYGVFVRPSQIKSLHGSELDPAPTVRSELVHTIYFSLNLLVLRVETTVSNAVGTRTPANLQHEWSPTRQFFQKWPIFQCIWCIHAIRQPS